MFSQNLLSPDEIFQHDTIGISLPENNNLIELDDQNNPLNPIEKDKKIQDQFNEVLELNNKFREILEEKIEEISKNIQLLQTQQETLNVYSRKQKFNNKEPFPNNLTESEELISDYDHMTKWSPVRTSFVDRSGIQPPDNEDKKMLKKYLLKRHPKFTLCKKWSNNEDYQLTEIVKEQILLNLATNLLKEWNEKDYKKAILIEKSFMELKNQPDELIFSNTKEIDWDLVSKYVVNRTPESCMLHWHHVLSPLICHDKWTQHELDSLSEIANRHNARNWIMISQEQYESTHIRRTVSQCFTVYQRYLASKFQRFPWTQEEDELLIRLYNKFPKRWTKIAEFIPNRNAQQCLHRYGKRISPTIKKKQKWTFEEDSKLVLAMKIYGKNWALITKHLPGRSDLQCRERFTLVLNPTIKKGKWEMKELELFIEGVKKYHPPNWSKISTIVKSRSNKDCRSKWVHMEAHPEKFPIQIISQLSEFSENIKKFLNEQNDEKKEEKENDEKEKNSLKRRKKNQNKSNKSNKKKSNKKKSKKKKSNKKKQKQNKEK
ncbi:snRNA-activating protein complex subunit 4 [Anaeramoeba ignava]|uniref:snRNA-activating protein complex subunit 4 n=1 Tax=Anaeramoeba ignava TaxID=1746090 RepID=A0A9Q0LET0_ANAIG|nr:snRNA-activating protein complex subunit 4 [Anaeramoeba ignava]